LGSGVLRASSFEPFVTNSETESFLYMRRLITHSGDTVFDDDDDDDRMTMTMIAIYSIVTPINLGFPSLGRFGINRRLR
jgi:hypothetical protein